jgi:cytochrome c oxidase assembly protein subunit 15
MSHFLLALTVLAAGVVVAVEAFSFERGRSEERLPLLYRRGAFVGAAALLALVLTGMISTAAGPHPGSADVERLWRLHAAVYVHVRATAIFGVLFLAFFVYVIRNRERWPLYAEGAGALLFLLLLQMGVGELQYRTHLPWWLVLVHVGLAAAVWACAVALVTVIERPPKPFSPLVPTLPR